ncbi:DUF1996 domain-containing protein [Streptomyces sp. TS71-3]|uniref:DUF1996 domain-containing protein n=1 Tax=Streptomyces sp. TS71-3 TaxID=2733862 RepID=UPI002017C9CC|nr:DUF1996 domain-containing protein [Streptomyces sp. TS71-3]
MKRRFRFGNAAISLSVVAVVSVVVALSLVWTAGGRHDVGSAADVGPFPKDFVDIRDVPRSAPPAAGPDASTGTFTEDCGRNEDLHRNSDNLVQSPGLHNGAHHTHDYVGNLSTTAFSTDAQLAAARTTCHDGDRSTYYWPVLRRQDRPTSPMAGGGGHHGNIGEILLPSSVTVEYLGNRASDVVAMPRFLRFITGDPAAATAGTALAHAQWGCAGFPDRVTTQYPRCPDGRVVRTLDFPSCWNGLDTDSEDHRGHIAFPRADGACPPGTFPVPQLRLVIAYRVPEGAPIALDAFPEQKHAPITDHAAFVNVMTGKQMAEVVACLNDGRHCKVT